MFLCTGVFPHFDDIGESTATNNSVLWDSNATLLRRGRVSRARNENNEAYAWRHHGEKKKKRKKARLVG